MSIIFDKVKEVSDLQESLKPKDNTMLLQRALKLNEEAGEVAAEALKLTGYKGTVESTEDINNNLKEEAIDALICSLDVINHMNMTEKEVEIFIEKKLGKWKSKHLKK